MAQNKSIFLHYYAGYSYVTSACLTINLRDATIFNGGSLIAAAAVSRGASKSKACIAPREMMRPGPSPPEPPFGKMGGKDARHRPQSATNSNALARDRGPVGH